jgi:hypothetical protein
LPIALYKLGTLITGTVCRNRKYLSQAFRNRFQIGEKKYFRKGSVLALAMVQFCYCLHTAKQKTVDKLMSGMVSKKKLQVCHSSGI